MFKGVKNIKHLRKRGRDVGHFSGNGKFLLIIMLVPLLPSILNNF